MSLFLLFDFYFKAGPLNIGHVKRCSGNSYYQVSITPTKNFTVLGHILIMLTLILLLSPIQNCGLVGYTEFAMS